MNPRDYAAKTGTDARSGNDMTTSRPNMNTKSKDVSMSLEAQRIAIAEACGWKHDYFGYAHIPGWPLEMESDVSDDLNAMHEAEKVLTEEQAYQFGRILDQIMLRAYALGSEPAHMQKAVHATAAQRAEAFLKALNLWTAQ